MFFSGVGFGLMYLPAIVMVGFYFEKRRAFATGVAVCGSGIGAFVFAPLCEKLLTVYSWKGATWIISGITLNGVVMGCLFRPLEPRQAKPRTLSQGEAENALSSGEVYVCDNTEGNLGREGDQKAVEKVVENGVSQRNRPTSLPKKKSSRVLEPKDLLKAKLKGDLLDSENSKSPASDLTLQSLQNLSPTAIGDLDKPISASFDCLYSTEAEKEALERRARDMRRPLYRKDIFYSGSVANLKEFKASNLDLTSYVASMTSIPKDIPEGRTGCLWACARMCKSLTDTMRQMMDFSLLLNPVFAVYGMSCFLCMAGKTNYTQIVDLVVGDASKVFESSTPIGMTPTFRTHQKAQF